MNDRFLNNFSYIYVENAVAELDATRKILEKFPSARIVSMRHYKDVFNRPAQNFWMQKESRKLLLAEKKPPFLYSAQDAKLENYGFDRFYYTTPLLNCIYDCDYCYLQGAYQSANLVAFVNTEACFEACANACRYESILLSIAYDSDPMALEGLFGFVRAWLAFAANQPNLTLEVRTKSSNFRAIGDIAALDNVIFSFSLSPEEVVAGFEHHTPALARRLQAMADALNAGWRVRAVIDPVVKFRGWQEAYGRLLKALSQTVEAGELEDITIGALRFAPDHLKRMRKFSRSPLPYSSFTNVQGVARYRDEETVLRTIRGMADKYGLGAKIVG